MPLSLVKAVLFLALVALLAYLGIALTEVGGTVRIWAFAHEFTLRPVAAAIAAVLLAAAVWLALAILRFGLVVFRFLNGDPTAFSRHLDRRRERHGHDALAEAMRALASGEPALALARAQRAEKLLHRPDLTGLLIAQAAEAAGEGRKALDTWRGLLGHEDTRFIAIRGLVRRKMAEGDTAAARRLAEKALALKPHHVETQDILLRLQGESGDWVGARRTLAIQQRAGGLPRSLHRRRDAVLAAEEARSLDEAGGHAEAGEIALEANRLSPELVPAAVMAARTLVARGEGRKAARILRHAWEAGPHPDLAAAFAAIAPEEAPAQRLKRFAPLFARRPDHPETRMKQAELLLAVGDFDAAATAIGEEASQRPTQRGLALLAAARRGQGAPEPEVRGLLARALTAARGAQWCCDQCKAPAGHWHALCPSCGRIDTLSWREPDTASGEGDDPASGEWLVRLLSEGAGITALPADAPVPAAGNARSSVVEAELVDEPGDGPDGNGGGRPGSGGDAQKPG